ncbi:Telomeric repeat-binding factor 2-interacting protein 1 [Chaetomidium leptoderma]|uniref:DNA-binding protein RAP1 n=1 Tax=Chaetomidium leptoderma TaxID=669021 RepID=A0AAN6VSM0_9PEZI|nr:Telomeric repeat-binding factor 2-interacting protein 1 [Chaetomidium leptoderma]
MAAPIVYEGVNGKYEGTLFNGIKFWVSQRVPTRNTFTLTSLQDNGGKVVELEKYADVLIADHAQKKFAPAGSVSWKYIDESATKGELVNIEDHRIHHASVSRPVGSTNGKSTKVPYSQLDEQILVTWVRRAGAKTSGNKIYQDLAELYPQHSWHSWRDKWVKGMSFLREEDLPPVLAELPPPRAPPASGPETMTPAAIPRPTPAPSRPAVKPALGGDGEPSKAKLRFNEEDDKLLTEYVQRCTRLGLPLSGNKIYQDFAHPHHSGHSWRDRWLRHLSRRPSTHTSSLEPVLEPAIPHSKPTLAKPPANKAPRRPELPSPRPQAPPPRPTATVVPKPGPSRLQELKHIHKVVQAVWTIQPIWRGYLLRRNLQRAQLCLAAFQARALGFLTRHALGITEPNRKPEDTAWLSPVEGADDEPFVPDEPAPVLSKDDAEPTARGHDDEVRHAAPTCRKTTSILPREKFWRDFNQYNELSGVIPRPWVQVGHHTVDFWHLWRCATQEPHHASRDWEAIAENLSFDWIAEPLVPTLLKVAFEKHLFAFEIMLREFEGEDSDEEEGEEGEGEEGEGEEGEGEEGENEGEGDEAAGDDGDGDEEETGEEERSEGDDELEEETAQTSDGDFTSSPPMVALKRARRSSASSPIGSVRKRPRYDPSSEIPGTPEVHMPRTEEGTVSRAAAANQETPIRRPRCARRAAPISDQLDGPDDDDGALTPSHQLRSEIEAITPSKRPSKSHSAIPPLANQPLQSVEHDYEESSDSSDEFESISERQIRNPRYPTIVRDPPAPNENHHRRTLPWSKGKEPATAANSTPLPPERMLTTATPKVPSSSHVTRSISNPHPPSTSKPPDANRRPLDPGPIMKYFITQRYHPSLVACAVKATMCRRSTTALVQPVLDRLVKGEGLPADQRGVWTEEDDGQLREVGEWVDRMRGALPRRGDRAVFGGDEGKRQIFWGLVGKHGREGTFERREFLQVWDKGLAWRAG